MGRLEYTPRLSAGQAGFRDFRTTNLFKPYIRSWRNTDNFKNRNALICSIDSAGFVALRRRITVSQALVSKKRLNARSGRLGKLQIVVDAPPLTSSPDAPKSSFHGCLVAVKDNFTTLDFPTTCASNILRGFQSPYDATVVSRLRKAGAIIVAKTNMDEFAMGSHSIHSAYGPVHNGSNMESALSVGGSSGGSAFAVATDQCILALGTDTGGSVRLPAAYTGIVGFKPSYGLLSRHGVIPYANSLDTVGFMAKSCLEIFLAMSTAAVLLLQAMSPNQWQKFSMSLIPKTPLVCP